MLALVDQHPAPLTPPGPAPGGEVEIGAAPGPGGEQVGAQQAAEEAGRDQPPGLHHLAAHALLEAYGQHPPGALCLGDHGVALGDRDRQRLFDQHVLAGAQSRDRHLGVEGVRGQDQRDVGVLGPQCVDVMVEAGSEFRCNGLRVDCVKSPPVRAQDVGGRPGDDDPHRTEPNARPSRSRRCVNAYMARIGRDATTAIAIMFDQRIPYMPIWPAISTEIGYWAGSLRKVIA